MGRTVKVESSVIQGAKAVPVDVEASVSKGIPAFRIVGMVDSAVLEGVARIRCAIKDSGFTFPDANVTACISPLAVKKAALRSICP